MPLWNQLKAELDGAGIAATVVRDEPGAVHEVLLRTAPEAAEAVLESCGFAPLGPGAGFLARDDDGWLCVRVEDKAEDEAEEKVEEKVKDKVRRPARGLTVALLGPDGVGKSTLLDGLAAAYPLPIRRLYMGMWQGTNRPDYTWLHAVGAIAVRPFRVWWRVARGAAHVRRGRVVVFDRYTYDALLPITGPWRSLKRPYFWVLARLAPRPDLVLILDLPGEVAFSRKGESTPETLEAVRQGFLALVPRLRAEVVDASAPAEQVRADVVARIWRHHRARLSRDPRGRISRRPPAAPSTTPSAPAPAPPATPR